MAQAGTEAAVLLSEEQAPTSTPAPSGGRQKVAPAAIFRAVVVAVLVASALLVGAAVLHGSEQARPTDVSLRGLQQLASCYCDCDWATKDSCPKAVAEGTIQNCCFKHCCEKALAAPPDVEHEAAKQPDAHVSPSDQDTQDQHTPDQPDSNQ